MPFCRSVVFLITTFKIHPARGTQQTDTKKLTAQLCQRAGYRLPGDAWTLHLRGLINNQQNVSLLGRLFPHWTLSLRPLVSHLPFLVTQSERARPCSGDPGLDVPEQAHGEQRLRHSPRQGSIFNPVLWKSFISSRCAATGGCTPHRSAYLPTSHQLPFWNRNRRFYMISPSIVNRLQTLMWCLTGYGAHY